MDSARIVCRYGAGCTHTDPAHKENYWHPPVKDFNAEKYHTHYICNECGQAFVHLPDLQLHLKRKTAWSDVSLVGCRISCLVDNREWHEGFVRSLSRQGKHCVEFHLGHEKRWLNMKRIAFYISQRPRASAVFVHGPIVGRQGEYRGNDSNYIGDTRQATVDSYEIFSHSNDDDSYHKRIVDSSTRTSGSEATADEYKEDRELEYDEDGNLAPIEDMDDWVYVEDISLDYSFAQSVLFKITGGVIQETGHKTKGHLCVTEGDKVNSKLPGARGSLLYGELLPRGANKAFGRSHLYCENARVLYDLGMGTGKIAVQAFLQYRNLEYVYGIELSEGRFDIADDYVTRMVKLLGCELYTVERHPNRQRITVTEIPVREGEGRKLVLECGDMFTLRNLPDADVVMMETDIPVALHHKLCLLLNDMKVGARILSYHDLRKIWHYEPFSFRQLSANRHVSDRFPTSWSVQRGHHFFLWVKTMNATLKPGSMFDCVGVRAGLEIDSIDGFSSVVGSRRSSNHSSGGSRDTRRGSNENNSNSFTSRCSPFSIYRALSSLFNCSGKRNNNRRGKKIGANPDFNPRFGLVGDPLDKICPLDISHDTNCASELICSPNAARNSWRNCDKGVNNDIDTDCGGESYSQPCASASSVTVLQELNGPLDEAAEPPSVLDRESMATPPASPMRSFVPTSLGHRSTLNHQHERQPYLGHDIPGEGNAKSAAISDSNLLIFNRQKSTESNGGVGARSAKDSQLGADVPAGVNHLIKNVTARVADLKIHEMNAIDTKTNGDYRKSSKGKELSTDEETEQAYGCNVSPICRLRGNTKEGDHVGNTDSFAEVGFNTSRLREVLLDEEENGYVRKFSISRSSSSECQ